MARILYLSAGGLHDRRFLDRIHAHGHEVLYAYLVDETVRFPLPPVKVVNLGYRAIAGSGPIVSFRRFFGKIPRFLRALRLIRRFRPDILHAGWIPTVGFWAALSGFRPLVLTIWGTEVRGLARRKWWVRLITRFTLRRADAIVCDNLHTRDVLMELGGMEASRILVFPYGIELELFRRSEEARRELRARQGLQDEPLVIFTRGLDRFYGADRFIRAVAQAARTVPGLRAWILGDGPEKKALQELIAGLRLTDRIAILPPVTYHEMPACFSAADVYAACPEDDGSSLSMLEAMACGLPVIVPDVPAMQEWIENGVQGYRVPAKDVEQMSARLAELLGDAALRRRMSTEALRTVHDRANWAANYARLEAKYRDLAETATVRRPAMDLSSDSEGTNVKGVHHVAMGN